MTKKKKPEKEKQTTWITPVVPPDFENRAFAYALLLTPAQEAAVQRQEVQLRKAWNFMVRESHFTMRDFKWGRQTSTLAEASEIIGKKKNRGSAAKASNKRATEENISVEEALHQNRQAKIKKWNKHGRRRLGVNMAEERLYRTYKNWYGGQVSLLYGLVRKFKDSCENWLKKVSATAQAPNYKKDRHSVAIQCQINKNAWTPGLAKRVLEVDLSKLIGQTGTRCKVNWHRLLPVGAEIKQLAISGRPGRRFLICSCKCPRASVVKSFPATGQKAGIDTGYVMALTLVPDNGTQADRKEFQPEICRDRHFQKQQRKLQRKLDRQERANNPQCFDEKGCFIPGTKPINQSRSMLQTRQQIQTDNEHIADARKNYYHNTAVEILRGYDNLHLGDWRPPQESVKASKKSNRKAYRKACWLAKQAGLPMPPPPTTQDRRNKNRKGLDHALSMFTGIMKDKIHLASVIKTLEIIEEPWTTQECPNCKARTGPVGPTNIAQWTCSNCHTTHFRKAGAAQNISSRPGAGA